MAPSFPAMGYDPDVLARAREAVAENESAEVAVAHDSMEDAQTSHEGDDGQDAVKVIVRVRPPLDRELRGFRPYAPASSVDASGRAIVLSENLEAAASGGVQNGIIYNTYRFAFDRVYAPTAPQSTIYEESARNAVANVLVGYNASIIAFGQTGAGKTYTMTGELQGEGRGIIPRAIEDVFAHIQRDTGERCKFLVRASFLQIYNEVISDLLKPAVTNLNVREDKRRGVHVEGLSEWIVRTPADVYSLMERGAAVRTTGATKLNELSSRSHAIFQLIVEKSVLEEPEGGTAAMDGSAVAAAALVDGSGLPSGVRQTVRVGKLNLVDLAGSERVHLTGATGKRLEESKKINQSLSALGNVIAALTDPKGREGRPHVPYRDSKLTRILEDSLGGNCKTTFMAMISPAVEAFAESLSTLKFAHRAKCVRNAPRVNEDLNHRALLRKYEQELRRLRAELRERSKDLVDRRLVLQIEEARRREQADKIAAISALERQSAEIARQKTAMAALQSRITSMQSQLLIGGQGLEHTPAFRTLLAQEQARMRREYDDRVAELEAQRRAVQQDRAAAVKIRELMVKQRDVIHALLGRVNQLDARVLQLQGAVESAESRAKEAEDRLDNKTAEIIAMRKSMVSGGDGKAVALLGIGGCAGGTHADDFDPETSAQRHQLLQQNANQGATAASASASAAALDTAMPINNDSCDWRIGARSTPSIGVGVRPRSAPPSGEPPAWLTGPQEVPELGLEGGSSTTSSRGGGTSDEEHDHVADQQKERISTPNGTILRRQGDGGGDRPLPRPASTAARGVADVAASRPGSNASSTSHASLVEVTTASDVAGTKGAKAKNGPKSGDVEDTSEERKQARTLLREREALRGILKDKVLAVIGEMGSSMGESHGKTPGRAEAAMLHQPLRFSKQLSYLQRLVAATVDALDDAALDG